MSDSETKPRPEEIRRLCPECQAGILRLQHLTYFTWLNDELITVPNFPALVCDVCGRREYDPHAIKWLNTLLNPQAGRRTLRKNLPPNTDRLRP
jgi:YgiT-type zinc finger domain-containing protein